LKTNISRRQNVLSKDSLIALSLAGIWIPFVILSLVDIQIGNRLYNSIVSLDYTTRVAVTEAISRTGIPPINPSYFPGSPVKMTSLYYFWYILVSVIDKIGLNFLDGRHAMIASTIWSGLGLMALISIYLRIRTTKNDVNPWKLAVIGISSLAIGGLDILPTLVLIISSFLVTGKILFNGIIEHWNDLVHTWLTSLLWVPHHIASLIICITILILLHNTDGKKENKQIAIMIIIGLAFASALGLSIWITLVFCIFWGIWLIYQFFIEKNHRLAILMVIPGVVGFVCAYPFISDLLQGLAATDNFPLMVTARRFNLILLSTATLPLPWQEFIHIILLPVYLTLELGFFFIIAIISFKQISKCSIDTSSFRKAEILLIGVTSLLATFVRSYISTYGFEDNDFGLRAWLFGQFVLLIWSTDILSEILEAKFNLPLIEIPKNITHKYPLATLFLILGLITTISNAIFLRTWPLAMEANITMNTDLIQATNLGSRTYAARQAYRFINEQTQPDVIIQNNPTLRYDRPLGLYGNRQTAVSILAAYGVSQGDLNKLEKQIEPIFQSTKSLSWDQIDSICHHYYIDLLVVSDLDPLWNNLSTLKKLRGALFQNDYYSILPCDNY
jgi:hypothetical protein